MMLTRREWRHSTVLVLVLGTHLLFLLVLSGGRRQEPGGSEPEAMLFIDLPPLVAEPPLPAPRTASSRRSRTPARTQSAEFPGPTPPQSPAPEQPGIDWYREAQSVAKDQAVEGIRKQQRECEEARQHGKYPPGCPKKSYDPHWQPEEKKAGFIGIIPYVKLGKRCVIGLGFFGCTMDAQLPEPDGTLLKDMPDASRPMSSVPDGLRSPFTEAPRPLAVKPQ